MFDIIPNILTTLVAIAFPTFAAYKALQSPNPALLTPWLTYFLILTLLHTAENLLWSSFLSWLPLYAWARLFAHIYLLLPGPYQGAGLVWSAYVQPYIRRHERQIEMLLQDVHEKTRALGLGRIEQLWELLRTKLFGDAGRRDAAAASRLAPPASNTYVSSLLGRFSAPVAGPGAQSAGGDVLSMLGSAAAAAAASYAGGSSGGAASGKRSVSGGMAPPEDPRERRAWMMAQKDKLREMLGEVEKMERDGEGSTSGFETIDKSEAAAGGIERRHTAGGWGSYIWGGKRDDGKGPSADLAY